MQKHSGGRDTFFLFAFLPFLRSLSCLLQAALPDLASRRRRPEHGGIWTRWSSSQTGCCPAGWHFVSTPAGERKPPIPENRVRFLLVLPFFCVQVVWNVRILGVKRFQLAAQNKSFAIVPLCMQCKHLKLDTIKPKTWQFTIYKMMT